MVLEYNHRHEIKGNEHPDYVADLDWMCFSKGPYEFD